jgi:hypothetical protein
MSAISRPATTARALLPPAVPARTLRRRDAGFAGLCSGASAQATVVGAAPLAGDDSPDTGEALPGLGTAEATISLGLHNGGRKSP